MVLPSKQDPAISARFRQRGEYLYREIHSPLMDACIPLSPDLVKVVVYSLRFQLVKLTIVKFPHLFEPPPEYLIDIKLETTTTPTAADSEATSLHPPHIQKHLLLLQKLRMAIGELAPALALFGAEKRTTLDLGLLANLTADVLKTATEYSTFGMSLYYNLPVSKAFHNCNGP